MSALPLKADILSVSIDVRYVPIADIELTRICRTTWIGGFLGNSAIINMKSGPRAEEIE